MIEPGIMHDDTGIRSDPAPFSVADMVSSSWEKVTGGISDAISATGDKIAGAYNWTKGEIKGGAEFTVDKTKSLLWSVVFAAAALLAVYILIKKEVLTRG